MNARFRRILSRSRSIGLDSMCFIYYFEGNKMYGQLVKLLFSRLAENKFTAVTSVLTLAEILAHNKLQSNLARFEEAKMTLRTTPNLTIISVDETICEGAAVLKQEYKLTLPDAIQLATAIVASQDIFVSNDEKLRKVKEIKILLLDDFLSKEA